MINFPFSYCGKYCILPTISVLKYFKYKLKIPKQQFTLCNVSEANYSISDLIIITTSIWTIMQLLSVFILCLILMDWAKKWTWKDFHVNSVNNSLCRVHKGQMLQTNLFCPYFDWHVATFCSLILSELYQLLFLSLTHK